MLIGFLSYSTCKIFDWALWSGEDECCHSTPQTPLLDVLRNYSSQDISYTVHLPRHLILVFDKQFSWSIKSSTLTSSRMCYIFSPEASLHAHFIALFRHSESLTVCNYDYGANDINGAWSIIECTCYGCTAWNAPQLRQSDQYED